MPGPGGREKLVILGGGAAAITAAFELSRPGWRERFESITVYQVGWRLGGKGASGRGRHGRIEEHGLHLWLGFYENAFRVMQDCYAELGRPPGAPLARWDDAFKKSSRVVARGSAPRRLGALADPLSRGRPCSRRAAIPRDPPFAMWYYVKRGLELLWSLAASLPLSDDERRAAHLSGDDGERSLREWLRRPFGELADRARDAVHGAGLAALVAAIALAGSIESVAVDHLPGVHDRLLRLLQSFIDWVRDRLARGVDVDDRVYRIGQLVEIVVASIRGVVSDERPHQGLRGHRRSRVPRLAPQSRRVRRRRQVARPDRRLRSRVRISRRRSDPAEHGRGGRARECRAALLHLQGRDVLEDAGRHGRRGVRAALPGVAAPRRRSSASFTG